MTADSPRQVGANEMAGDAFLRVAHLGKSYRRRGSSDGTEVAVLQDVSLEAKAGEFVTVIGPSGCGKSTLLTCIAGLTEVGDGTIEVDGAAVSGPGPDRAVVFQHASLLPWRTIERNVGYGLELRRDLSRGEIRSRVARMLELVGLGEFAGHYPHEISGGMKQRANLARALVVEPKLVLMDEPFGALDAITKETLQDELAALAGRMRRTTVFITHDIEEAVFLGDKVVVMSPLPGRVAAELPVPFPRPRRREVTAEPEFAALVQRLRGLIQTAIPASQSGEER
ncbi:MAG: ABC transporter ATP-binding protein [Actinobacteria bacterium]|nr:ABC transporter ATP-binding protein [Actinomycetota bacterium]